MGWDKKEGMENKDLKKGEQLGHGVGALKKRGAGTLILLECIERNTIFKIGQQFIDLMWFRLCEYSETLV